MATFVCFFSYTAETWQKMQANPTDRTAALGALVERLGGTVVSMHFMLGPYDGLALTELPSATEAEAMSTIATSTGAFAELHTHALLGAEDMRRVLELAQAEGPSYSAPGT